QLIPTKIAHPHITEVESLEETAGGVNGFSSSGKGGRIAVCMAAVKVLMLKMSANPENSYKGDSKLEKIMERISSSEEPTSRAEHDITNKFHAQGGVLFKKGC
ncbi:hypothetical protein GGF37_002555, partial [Kickxella alabastrina]